MKEEYKQIISNMYMQEEMHTEASAVNWSKTLTGLIFSILMISSVFTINDVSTSDTATQTATTALEMADSLMRVSVVMLTFMGIMLLTFTFYSVVSALATGGTERSMRDMHYKEIYKLFYKDGFLSNDTYCLKFIKNSQECLDFGNAIKYNNDDDIQIHFNNTNITEDLKKCKNVIEQLEYMNSLIIML